LLSYKYINIKKEMLIDVHLNVVAYMIDFGDAKGYTAVVKFRISILLFLLIFSLLIQNTCPQGFAGKSTVASTCSHCPQKQTHKPAMEGNSLSNISKAPAHLPMYVLDMPNTQPTLQLIMTASTQPIIPNIYTNTAPDELLHPPRA
jgi:hypothetical protein